MIVLNYNGKTPKNKKSDGEIKISKRSIIAAACIALAFFNVKIFSRIITDNEGLVKSTYTQENPEKADDGEQENASVKAIWEDIAENFALVNVKRDDTERGNLILVNSYHKYNFEAVSAAVEDKEAVKIPDSADGSYWVKSNYDLLKPEALEAMDRLLSDFAAENNNTDVMIFDTYRSYEDQKRVLENKIEQLGEAEGKKIATEPGCSEHHTCLAVDLTLFNGSSYAEYDGTGMYEWITENCYKYGFVIRYPENKSDITGISYEPWHLRYVGKEHAYYMTKNGLCLEEYIEMLSTLPVESKRLTFTTDDGDSFAIYSCTATGDGEDFIQVYVPKNGEYTLSGDNDGRIIVTCKMN